MPRPITLFTGQWADLPLSELAPLAKSMGYDGLELACWGDHFNVQEALRSESYVREKWALLKNHGLKMGFDAIVQNDIGKADPRLTQIQQAVEIAARPREGNRDRGSGTTLRSCRIDRRSDFFGSCAVPLTCFSGSNLQRDGEIGRAHV